MSTFDTPVILRNQMTGEVLSGLCHSVAQVERAMAHAKVPAGHVVMTEALSVEADACILSSEEASRPHVQAKVPPEAERAFWHGEPVRPLNWGAQVIEGGKEVPVRTDFDSGASGV